MAFIVDTMVAELIFKAKSTGLKKAGAQINKIEHKAERTSHALEGLRGVLETIGIGFAATELIHLNNEFDVAQNKIRSVGVQGKQLIEVQKSLLEIGNATGSTLESVSVLYQQLSMSLGNAATQAQKLRAIKTVSELFAVSGISAQESKMAIMDMSRALEGNTVRWGEIKRAMQDAPALGNAVKEAFKKQGLNYQEAMKGNKFSTKAFVKILGEASKTADLMFTRTVRTMGQSLTAFKNTLEEVIGTFDKSTGILGSVTSSLDFVTQSIGDVAGVTKKAGATTKAFGQTLLVLLSALTARFLIMRAATIASFAPMIIGFTLVTLALQDFFTFMDGGRSVIGGFLKTIGLSQSQLDAFRNGVTWAGRALKHIAGIALSSRWILRGLGASLALISAYWAVSKVIAFANALNVVKIAMAGYEIVQKAATLAVGLFDVVLSPIGIGVLAIVAGITLLILAFAHAKTVTAFLSKEFHKFLFLVGRLKGAVPDAFRGITSEFKHLVGWVGNTTHKLLKLFDVFSWFHKGKSKKIAITATTKQKNTISAVKKITNEGREISERYKGLQGLNNSYPGVMSPKVAHYHHTVIKTPQKAISINSAPKITINVNNGGDENAPLIEKISNHIEKHMKEHARNLALNFDSRIKR